MPGTQDTIHLELVHTFYDVALALFNLNIVLQVTSVLEEIFIHTELWWVLWVRWVLSCGYVGSGCPKKMSFTKLSIYILDFSPAMCSPSLKVGRFLLRLSRIKHSHVMSMENLAPQHLIFVIFGLKMVSNAQFVHFP